MAGFCIGHADEQKEEKGVVRDAFVNKAPSERGLPSETGGGECENDGKVLERKRAEKRKFRGLLPPQAVPLPPGGRLLENPFTGSK